MIKTVQNIAIGASILSAFFSPTQSIFAQSLNKNSNIKIFVKECIGSMSSNIDPNTAKEYCECSAEIYYKHAYNEKTKELKELSPEEMKELLIPCTSKLQDETYANAKAPNSNYRKLSIERCINQLGDSPQQKAYCECATNKTVDNLTKEQLRKFDEDAEKGEEIPDFILKLVTPCLEILTDED